MKTSVPPHLKNRPFLIVAAATAAIVIQSAPAASINWLGTTDTAWASGSNWAGGVAPTNDLATDIAAFNAATYPNFPNAGTTSIAGLAIGGSSTAALTISGTSLSLGSSGITKALGSGTLTLSPGVVIGANQSWTNSATTSGITVGGALTGTGNLTLSTTASDAATIQFNGNMSGYTGNISVSGGRFTTNNGANLPAATTVTVNAGAQNFANSSTAYNLVISGNGYGGGANSAAFRTSLNTVHSGTLTVAGSATISSFNRTSTISGQITSTGAGDVTFGTAGITGTMTLSNAANNWAGATTVVGSYTLQSGTQTVGSGVSEILPDTTALTLTGTFNQNGGTTETVASLSGAGIIQNQAASTNATFVVNGGAGATFNGIIRDNAGTGGTVSFRKSGAGIETLSGANTYTGTTTIDGGVLQIGASNRLADTSNMVLSGGTFATAGFSEAVGTLTINTNSFLDFGSGASAISFLDSSAIAWTGTLSLQNFDLGSDTLRFGTSASALTDSQLGAISLDGYTASLDNSGFVTFTAVPEPSVVAMLIAGLGVFWIKRCHRRASRAAQIG